MGEISLVPSASADDLLPVENDRASKDCLSPTNIDALSSLTNPKGGSGVLFLFSQEGPAPEGC